jgi:hypothetical protein
VFESVVPLLISLAVGVTLPAPTFIVIFCTVIDGAVLSTINALFAPSEPESPVAGNVNVAEFPAESFIVPLFHANAVVEL